MVGIGASAGGVGAAQRLLAALPDSTGMAFVLIQHLDPTRESLMVDTLARHTRMTVLEARDHMPVEADRLYVIPPDRNLTLEDGRLRLAKPGAARGFRMPIDVFLRSLAEVQQEKAIGVILSGAGTDGTAGLVEIKSHGGMTIVQDPQTADLDGMPRSAIATKLVDFVVPVEQMPDLLVRYVRHPYVNGHALETPDVNAVTSLLRTRLDFDFRHYKQNTILRRIQRRMGLRHVERLSDYVEQLRGDDDELKRLYRDLLIGVTGFFREPEAFAIIENEVLPALLRERSADDALRVWVPGCATGEEAYSLGMLFLERLESARKPKLQIFATDVDEEALAFARAAIYPESLVAGVPPPRLQRFFERDDHHYRVKQELREVTIFGAQNVLGDAPFSKLDLISCRNLLIYLEPAAQKDLIALFHFALKPGGYLFLGSAETVGSQDGLFANVSRQWRVYRRTGEAGHSHLQFPIMPRADSPLAQPGRQPRRAERAVGPSELAQRVLLDEYAPASALIDRRHEILYLFGPVGKFLDVPGGEPTRDLIEMARPGLGARLRAAIHKAVAGGEESAAGGVGFQRNGDSLLARIRVKPLRQLGGGAEGLLLVTFEEQDAAEAPRPAQPPDAEEESLVQQLEEELKSTKDDLESTIEELESSNEELKSSNEEVLSINEELQSTNEELETSKEELQSLNEELTTVNNQLRSKVDQLETTNNDLDNLLASAEQATLFLDRHLRIRWFSSSTSRLLPLRAGDLGRPLGDFAPRFASEELIADAEEVLETLVPAEREVQGDDGRTYIRRVLSYKTAHGHVGGVVVTFVEVTRLHQAQAELAGRAREQELVAQLSRRALGGVEFGVLLNEAVWAVRSLLEVDLCGVLELLPDGRRLQLRAGEGWKELRHRELPVGAGTQTAFALHATKPVVVEDLARERRFKPAPLLRDHAAVSGMTAAIRGQDRTYGLLVAFTRQQRGFTPGECRFLDSVADVLALAQQNRQVIAEVQQLNKHLEQRVQERTLQLDLVRAVAVIANQASSLEQAFREAVRRICETLGWSAGHAYILQPDGHFEDSGIWAFQGGAEQRRLYEISRDAKFRRGSGILGRAAASGEPLSVGGSSRDPRLAQARRVAGAEVRSIVAIPVKIEGRVAALLEFFVSHEIEVDAALLALTEPVGTQLGRVLERTELGREIAELADHERRRMGRDLHDSVGQQLAGLSLLARGLERKLRSTRSPQTDQAAQLLQGVEEAKNQTKALARGMLIAEVKGQDLVPALKQLAANFAVLHGIRCAFESPRPVRVEDDTVATHLYQIAQEALHNSVVHGRAHEIVIRLDAGRAGTLLQVRDDGRGVPAKSESHGGMGLRIMRYRAGIIGGALSIETERGRGTTVSCVLPPPPQEVDG